MTMTMHQLVRGLTFHLDNALRYVIPVTDTDSLVAQDHQWSLVVLHTTINEPY